MELKEILRLMAEKYPTNYRKGLNPVLFIYDDESGRILKDAQESAYTGYNNNSLFEFTSIDGLIKHLQEK